MPSLLADRFEVSRWLGSGAYADVYYAIDRETGREAAIKLLRPEFATDSTTLRRFRREARATEAISHPNVVQIFDHAISESQQFLIMEYVPGTDLNHKIRETGPLAPEHAVAIMRQILSGLEAIHASGQVHRDIKPHNIYVAPDGGIKIGDFSIARAAADSRLTRTGATLGTAAYMAPEQATGQAVGPPADVYAAGVILFEMTTGMLPFSGDDPLEVLYQQVHQEPPHPHRYSEAISPALETIILTSLSKRPEDRYPSASEMAAALDQLQSGDEPTEPVSVIGAPLATATAPHVRPSPGTAPQSRMPRLARPIPVAGFILGLIALIVIALGAAALTVNRTGGDDEPLPVTTGDNAVDDANGEDEAPLTAPPDPAEAEAEGIDPEPPEQQPDEPEQEPQPAANEEPTGDEGAGESLEQEEEPGSSPGQSQGDDHSPPGQNGTPPGQNGTPPGQNGTPPGQNGTPPGQNERNRP